MADATLDEQIEFVAVLIEAQETTTVAGVGILRRATGRELSRELCLRLLLDALARRDQQRRAAGRARYQDGWW